MINEEHRRLGEVADVLDAIEFNFSNLVGRLKDATKLLHVRTRSDVYILGKNLERSIKTGQGIVSKLLAEEDELKAERNRTNRLTELKGSLEVLELVNVNLELQRKTCLEEIDAIDEKMRKRRTKKRPAPVKRRA